LYSVTRSKFAAIVADDWCLVLCSWEESISCFSPMAFFQSLKPREINSTLRCHCSIGPKKKYLCFQQIGKIKRARRMLDLFLLIFVICLGKIRVLNYITFFMYILLLKYFNCSFYLYQLSPIYLDCVAFKRRFQRC